MSGTDPHFAMISDYYGKALQSSKDLKTSACCPASKPHPELRKHLANIPQNVLDRFYGCGNPVPLGIEGLSVLDLGCGSGRDVYLAAGLVGKTGSVIGVDMTEEQLVVAQEALPQFQATVGYSPKISFVRGYMERLTRPVSTGGCGIPANSIDICISNCVVNLSPDKLSVLQEVYKTLKTGGEFYFSDIYADRRIPTTLRSHEILQGECLAGALYINDFLEICRTVGFKDPRMLATPVEVIVEDPALATLCGDIRFYSITYRLFKFPPTTDASLDTNFRGSLESGCEDYVQVAIYTGAIAGHPEFYDLDEQHRFPAGEKVRVDGNTAEMVGSYSWLGKYFELIGDRGTHFGTFKFTTTTSNNPVARKCC
ncbi:S-adenosyl-L-methionine-dependent methyltransferase [Phlyctochytrium arcticum]|nr:S-adenosyl-L-methionine-dependent methyltransferase [Phlyctochytrium arcticum]